MQIKLKNIGIIKDSMISLDGLTVITGKNNSGKTTVGKVIYSLFDAVANIQRKARSDKCYYVERQLEDLDSILEFFRYFRILMREEENNIFANYPAIQWWLSGEYRRELSLETMEISVHKFIDELMELDTAFLANYMYSSKRYVRISKLGSSIDNLKDTLEEQKEKAISLLQKVIVDINKDPELIDYARESINQTLKVEFSNQIQPVKAPNCKSEIELSDTDTVYFHCGIENNNVINDGTPIFMSSPCKNVYFIDDPFILDDVGFRRFYRGSIAEGETFFNANRISSHNTKLKAILRSQKKLSVFEQNVLGDALKEMQRKIDTILPGTFEFSPEGNYYVQGETKLKISNLATGSKMFSIIKMLLNIGEINSTTMLILDEPEAHLHPMWQNAFAEIMVLLVKELNVNILLTTHSPNFMLALDAYMRKYHIAEKTNFYQTDSIENGFVQYTCVNDDMGKIYQDFLQYLSEVKMLRNSYIGEIEE